MASQCNLLMAEVNTIFNTPQGSMSLGNIKGQFIDFLVSFLERNVNIKFEKDALDSCLKLTEQCKFLKRIQGQGRKALKGWRLVLHREKEGSMNLMKSFCPSPSILLTSLWDSGIFFPFFSHWLDYSTFQPRALILFLIYLTPAVARAFLLKGLVQRVWSLKQTLSTWRQHSVLERTRVRMPKSESGPARSSLESLEPTAESHSSHP